MENEKNKIVTEPIGIAPASKDYTLPASILIAALILAGAWVYTTELKTNALKNQGTIPASALEEEVLPSQGVILPVSWGNLGKQLVSAGVIDADKLQTIYDQRGTFTEEYQALLLGQNDSNLTMTKDNAGYLLNLFWALGLANKNAILEEGPMNDPRYGGAGVFASTGGWTIANGDPMDHYSRHVFFALSTEQQALVDKVSKGIYRPCCNNSTHFPDCNHGMAMLGLLELMAFQGVREQEMWKAALAVNSYWFPDTYLTIATYMKNRGVDWKDVNPVRENFSNGVNPQEILGSNFSSASGYAQIAAQVEASQQQRGRSGCGIELGETTAQQREQSGCEI